MWAVSKAEMYICFTGRIEEGRDEGAVWEFLLDMGMEEG